MHATLITRKTSMKLIPEGPPSYRGSALFLLHRNRFRMSPATPNQNYSESPTVTRNGSLDEPTHLLIISEFAAVRSMTHLLIRTRSVDARPDRRRPGERCGYSRRSVEQAALGGDLRAEFFAPGSDGGVRIVGGQGVRAIVFAPGDQLFQRRFAWRLVAPP